jgi:hypothetical protein
MKEVFLVHMIPSILHGALVGVCWFVQPGPYVSISHAFAGKFLSKVMSLDLKL